MNKNKAIITLGFLIALLPVLGFPRVWESFFQVGAGLAIAGLSVWVNVDRRITRRVKAQKRQEVRQLIEGSSSVKDGDAPSDSEDVSVPQGRKYGRRITDFYPRTGQSGRREADNRWNSADKPL